MQKMLRDVSWFVVVGCAAAATHWLIAVASVAVLNFAPLLANLVGWMVAFFVSFSGHYLLTFRHQPKKLLVSLGRFFLVSAGGFLINELAYAYLLQTTTIPYDLLLAEILVGIAVLTFIVSRLWAFRHKPAAS